MPVSGAIVVPGDKSITHRALLLAAMAPGESRIRGALTSFDARSTARVLRQLGALIGHLREGADLAVRGVGRLRRPPAALNCGNSGTTARLLMGLLAAHPFRAVLTGDSSLRRRPMRRVTEPLGRMGARFEGRDPDRLPLVVEGGALAPLTWELPVASAQVKGALLLAGAAAGVAVRLREAAGPSRDHTERLLRSLGYAIDDRGGWIVMEPTGAFQPLDLQVPGDPSSAAFLIGAAILADRGSLRLPGVGVNPTRTGFLRVLARMGAEVRQESETVRSEEPVADLVAEPARLRGVEVNAAEVPSLIDEVPILAVLASQASGSTVFRGVGELRVKESDRLSLLADNLRAVGGRATVQGDDLIVEGTGLAPRGRVRTDGDHRIAMAFAVLGTAPGASIEVDDPSAAEVSFPHFDRVLRLATGGPRR